MLVSLYCEVATFFFEVMYKHIVNVCVDRSKSVEFTEKIKEKCVMLQTGKLRLREL